MSNESCGCWVAVALTERYKRLRNRIIDRSKQLPPVPVISTIASLESWLNEAERVLTSRQNTTPGSIAQLESAIRQHRVWVFCTYFYYLWLLFSRPSLLVLLFWVGWMSKNWIFGICGTGFCMQDVKSAASKHCTTHGLIVLLALISSNETLLLFYLIVSDNAAMQRVTF